MDNPRLLSRSAGRYIPGRRFLRLQTFQQHLLPRAGTRVVRRGRRCATRIRSRLRTVPTAHEFFSFFVSDRSDALESLFVPSGNRLVASSNKSFSDRYDTSGQERTVSTITLNDLLPRAGFTRVDFLSMDIELAEPKALACFDLARYRPRLAVVEAHPDVRQQIIDYFADRGTGRSPVFESRCPQPVVRSTGFGSSSRRSDCRRALNGHPPAPRQGRPH